MSRVVSLLLAATAKAIAPLMIGALICTSATVSAQDALAEVNRLNGLVVQLYGQGRYADAIEAARRALALADKTLKPEHPAIATSLNSLAVLYRRTGQYAQALPLYQRALAIREKAPGPEDPDTAISLNNLAELYRSTGQYALALPLHQRALAIREKAPALGPEHPDTAESLNNLALLYVNTGQYALAIPLYRRAFAIAERFVDGFWGINHPWTAVALTTYSNMGSLYRDTGQYAEALPLLERVLEVREHFLGPDHPDVARSLENLAGLHYAMGQYAQAETLIKRALAIRQDRLAGDHPDIALSLNNLGGLYFATGRHAEALPMMQRAERMTESALGPDHERTAQSLNNLAAIYDAIGRSAEALPLYVRALRVATAAGSPEMLWAIHGSLMYFHAPTGAPARSRSTSVPLAIWHGKQAVNTLQTVSAGLRDVDAGMQRSFLRSNSWYYTRLADLLVQEGRIAEAEQVLAMLKERELSDLIERSDVRRTHVDDVGAERAVSRQGDVLAARGVKLSSELDALERKAQLEPLGAAEAARRDELLRAAQGWRDEYQRWIGALAQIFEREGKGRASAESASERGERLSDIVSAEPRVLGLHYVVTDERIAIVVATPRGSFGRFSNVKREDLRRQIGALREAILGRADVRPAAQALYRTLIEPIEGDLKAADPQTLVLSLTDTLRYVPFAALHDGRQYLVERYALSHWTSAGGSEPLRSREPWRVAALGLTQPRPGFDALPSVASELRGIVRTEGSPEGVLPGQILLDPDFSRDNLLRALDGGYSVVHVASHFDFRPGDESHSGLLPGTGDLISLRDLEVWNWRRVEQLTLSACNTATGGGRNENGAEVEGLAASVQRKGAKSVLATLWKVADASTAQLMRRFYAQRAQSTPPSRAEALRQAQLALLRGATASNAAASDGAERSARPDGPVASPMAPAPPAADPGRPYAHPFFWAPFVLSGNWL